MNVSLTPELEKYVVEKTKSGLFSSASEVVRHALRSLMLVEREEPNLKEQLMREIEEGLLDLKHGRLKDGDLVLENIRKKNTKQL